MKIHALTLTSPDFDTLHSIAIPMLESGSDVVTVLHLPAETEASFGTASFNSICWAKITGINAVLEKMDERDVLLYTDADVMLFVTAGHIVVRALEIMAETGKAMVRWLCVVEKGGKRRAWRGRLAAAGPHQVRQARTGSPSGCITFGFLASPQAGVTYRTVMSERSGCHPCVPFAKNGPNGAMSWWVVRDSNPRHLRCKRSALPTELTTR